MGLHLNRLPLGLRSLLGRLDESRDVEPAESREGVDHDVHVDRVDSRLSHLDGKARDFHQVRRLLLAGEDDVKTAPKPVEKPKKASRDEILALRAEVRKCEDRIAKLEEIALRTPGVAPAAIQEIMPNSMRGQASALYLLDRKSVV